jgi:hypothetical protein
LVILFPRDTAAVTVLDANDVWAFYAGMSRHDIWHLGVDQQYPGGFRAPENSLANYLVRLEQEVWGDGEAERVGGLEVDD